MQSEKPHDLVKNPTPEQIIEGRLVALTDAERDHLQGATPLARAAFLDALETEDLERRWRGLLPGDPDPESARVGEMSAEEFTEFKALAPDIDRDEWLKFRGLKGQTFRTPLGSPSGSEPVPRKITPETIGGPPREDPPPPDASPEDVGDYHRRRAARATALRIVEDLQNRFTYHPPQPGQPELYEDIRRLGLDLALRLSTACPQSRELSLAYTHLEQTVMWANAAIARAPAPRALQDQPLEPQRGEAGDGVFDEPDEPAAGQASGEPVVSDRHEPGPSAAKHHFQPGVDGVCAACQGESGDAMHLQGAELEALGSSDPHDADTVE